MFVRAKWLSLTLAVLAVQGCASNIQFYDRAAPPTPSRPVETLPAPELLPPADFVAVNLVDGSPGLALWCDVRSDCINAARQLCDNRQSIRSEFDIDRTSPGASRYFSASPNAAHQLTVSCPV